MSLQDKLNENKSMSELFQETRELNDLMRSYIRVQMNEASAKDMTVQNQLENIKANSNQIMSNMQSILNRQEQLLEKNAEHSQEILTTGFKEIQANNKQTIDELNNLKASNTNELQNINKNMEKRMSEIESRTKSLLDDTSREAKALNSKTRKDVLINNWLDAFKYGLAGGVITAIILAILYFFFVM